MGLTIDEIIDDLTELKTCGVFPFTKGTLSGGNYKIITKQSLNEAIDIMKKYQKIEEIVKSKTTRLSYEDGFRQIKEVLENEVS